MNKFYKVVGFEVTMYNGKTKSRRYKYEAVCKSMFDIERNVDTMLADYNNKLSMRGRRLLQATRNKEYTRLSISMFHVTKEEVVNIIAYPGRNVMRSNFTRFNFNSALLADFNDFWEDFEHIK